MNNHQASYLVSIGLIFVFKIISRHDACKHKYSNQKQIEKHCTVWQKKYILAVIYKDGVGVSEFVICLWIDLLFTCADEGCWEMGKKFDTYLQTS